MVLTLLKIVTYAIFTFALGAASYKLCVIGAKSEAINGYSQNRTILFNAATMPLSMIHVQPGDAWQH